jgi:tetratricopeptide (TPR) repeat protein
MAVGRLDEAIAEAQRAEDLAPGSSVAMSYAPWISLKARRFAVAVAGFRGILEIDPHAFFADVENVFSLTRLGRLSEAGEHYARARKAVPRGTEQVADSWMMEYELAAGMKPEAEKTLAHWLARRRDIYVDGYNLAWMCSALGRKDEAIRWLETAYAERSGEIYAVKVDPTLDALRGDPRFEALVKRMRFPE